MNKTAKTMRRRWSFEKGRNSRTALSAAVVSLISVALFFCIFKYERSTSDEKFQRTAVSTLNQRMHGTFIEMIERRDPAKVYGVNGGSYSTLLPGRNYNIDSDIHPVYDVVQYERDLPEASIKIREFPVSAKYPAVLPAAAVPAKKRPSPQITDQHGKLLKLDKLAIIKNKSAGECIIRIAGQGMLTRAELIKSSGDAARDRQAALILKVSGITPGTYIINWSGE